MKFFQFMLIICTAQLFFAGIVWMLLRTMTKKKADENAGSEHIVAGLFTLTVMLGMVLILKVFAENMIGDLVPGVKFSIRRHDSRNIKCVALSLFS